MQLAWSYVGRLPSGWSQGDEEKWDEVIEDVVEQLESGEALSKDGRGGTVMKLVACVVIAKTKARGSLGHTGQWYPWCIVPHFQVDELIFRIIAKNFQIWVTCSLIQRYH